MLNIALNSPHALAKEEQRLISEEAWEKTFLKTVSQTRERERLRIFRFTPNPMYLDVKSLEGSRKAGRALVS